MSRFKVQPAIVRPARQEKKLHFTTSIIGGKEDLERWREERKRIDKEWYESRAELRAEYRANAIVGVSGDKAPTLTDIDRAEIAWLKACERDEAARTAAKAPAVVVAAPIVVHTPFLTKITQGCKQWLANLWHTAFDSL